MRPRAEEGGRALPEGPRQNPRAKSDIFLKDVRFAGDGPHQFSKPGSCCGLLRAPRCSTVDPDLSDEIAIQMMCQNLRSRYVDVQELKNMTKKT